MSHVVVPEWLRVKREHLSAQDLLNRFELKEPPIDVYLLAKVLEVDVQFSSDLNCSGALKVEGGVPWHATILVAQDSSETHKRFTVAHEIGHLILHDVRAGTMWRDTDFRGNRQEQQANGYAAKLLMPQWMLDSLAHRHNYDARTLASIFHVSDEAMKYRLDNLYGAN